MKNENDVVVTGMGLVSPIGVGLSDFTQSLLDRKSGIKVRKEYAATDWPFRIGGVVDDYDPKQYVKPRKSLKLMCREIQFGFGAAQMAIEDSGIDFESVEPTRVGVVCGSDTFYCDPESIVDSYVGERETIRDVGAWVQRAIKKIEPLWMLKYLPNMIASHIAIAINAQGPNNSIIQGDASGLLALAEAADVIRRGWTDVMVTGGTGSKINPIFLSYHGVADLAAAGDDPATACRPFDRHRTGTVVGEGAGMIVIERRRHAEARGARIYATLAACEYGCAPREEQAEIDLIARNIERSIHKAGLKKSEVSHVNSDAAGSVAGDRIVAQAIHRALGDVGVTAYKGHFGDLGPAGAMIETCAAIDALHAHRVPATINYETPDDNCPVRVITEHLEERQKAVMKLSSSKTGQKIAMLLTAEE